MQIIAPRFLSVAMLALASAISYADAFNVVMHGINYNSRIGPDWAPKAQKCKTDAQIEQDMYTIKKMSDSVRIYSLVDCDQGLPVAKAAKKAGLKLALGIWTTVSPADMDKEMEQLNNIINAGYLGDNISGFHVGSEAIYRKDISIDTAIGYLNRVRDYLHSRNIWIPMTVADVVDSYMQYPQLIDAVDYISLNQFSFWERADISEGVPTMLDRIKPLRITAAAKGKKIVIGETGWSSQGSDPTKASIASSENQARYFKDFYQMATSHGFDYYWFMAFDSLWRVQNGDHEIEGNFGVYKEDQTMKANFNSLTIATRDPKQVRSVGSQLLLTQNDRALSMTSDASATDWLKAEQQTWYYDKATSTLRSKGNDRCLDTYQPYDGGDVRLYACIDNEKNQKWNYDASTGHLSHGTYTAFCLDTDPAQNNKLQIYGCSAGNKNQQWTLETPGQGASSPSPSVTPAPAPTPAPVPETPAPVSDGSVRFYTKESASKQFVQLVRIGEEIGLGYGAQQGVANSEWWYNPSNKLVQSKDSNYCLDAYERWDGGRVHVWACNANEQNQMWSFDTSTGQLKHLAHSGFCLDADQSTGKVSLYGCHLNNNNQVWRKVSNVAKGVVIGSATASGAVLEPTAQDTVVGLTASNRDGQQWFWDAAAKRFLSKWRDECLDAYEAWEGGRVHTYACIDGEANQNWTYDAAKNAVKHAKHTGFCLAYNNMSAKLLQLKACRDDDETQRIRITAV